MPQAKTFQDFEQQSVKLMQTVQNPDCFRFVMKYSHCKGELKATVTDSVTTCSYQTKAKNDLKKLEALNLKIMTAIFSKPSA